MEAPSVSKRITRSCWVSIHPQVPVVQAPPPSVLDLPLHIRVIRCSFHSTQALDPPVHSTTRCETSHIDADTSGFLCFELPTLTNFHLNVFFCLFLQQDQFNGQGGGLNALPAGGAAGVYSSFNQQSGVRRMLGCNQNPPQQGVLDFSFNFHCSSISIFQQLHCNLQTFLTFFFLFSLLSGYS